MTPFKHWQDPVSAVLGLWLAVSPWILGFHSDVAAMPNAVIVGLAIFVVALAASGLGLTPFHRTVSGLRKP